MWRWPRYSLVVLFSGAASWIMNLINNRIAYRTVQDIRAKAIRHIQKLPLSYLDSHSTGDIISRITADADILSDGLLLGFTQLFSGMVTIIGTLVFMFSRNVVITIMVIVLTPLSFFVAKFISSHSFQMFQRQSSARGQQTALIEEMIGNQKLVQAFGYQDKASERFARINEELRESSQQAVFTAALEILHGFCQQCDLCRSRPCRRFPDSGRRSDCRWTFCDACLCQSVYEAL